MKNALKAVALAGALVGATAISAAAATLQLVGVSATQGFVNYDLGLGSSGGTIAYVIGSNKTGANGLQLVGPGTLQYTYIGSEAGNLNFSTGTGAGFTEGSAVGSSLSPIFFAGGFLNFGFGTSAPLEAQASIQNNGGASGSDLSKLAIGYKVAADGKSAFIYFDDIAGNDRDFDDFVVRVSVSAVPVPAAGFLLVGALGGLVALRRRKTI